MYDQMPCGNTQAEIDNDRPATQDKDSDDYDRTPYVNIETIRYENIVYQNIVAGLLAGAEMTARNGSDKYKLCQTAGMTVSELNLEARVLASRIVG